MKNIYAFSNGLRIEPVVATAANREGELEVIAGKLNMFDGSVTREFVTLNQSQVLTNKTISGTVNTLSNIAYSSLAALTSGNIIVGNVSNVAASVALTGDATISNIGAITVLNSSVIGKVLTGFVSGAGTVSASDTILQAFNKLAGNASINTGDVTLTAIGATANANGATLTGQVLNLQPASASFGGVVTTGTQTIAGDKTLSGNTLTSGRFRTSGVTANDQEDNAVVTGANATLTTPTKGIVRLTNASLTSVDGITAPSVPQYVTISNVTGAAIVVNNDTGTAANRILTGTGNGISLANNATIVLYYDQTTTKWRIVGGSGGGGSTAVVSKTANYTAVAGTDNVILCSASGGAFTITLPAVASNSGIQFTIKKTDSTASVVTIDGNASETIDGALTKALANQYDSFTIVCSGTAWSII